MLKSYYHRVCRDGLRIAVLIAAVTALSACNLNNPPKRTATPPPTLTATALPSPTLTPIPTLPPSPTVPTEIPTITLTPSITFTPSPIPSVTRTPYPPIATQEPISLALDNLSHTEIDSRIASNAGRSWLSVININDKLKSPTPGTPPPASTNETIYLMSPDDGSMIKLIDLPATTAGHVYWSPNGVYMAYFLEEGSRTGLYMLNVQNGGTLRLFAISNLSPHSILSEPVWTANSKQITMTLSSAYATNIFSVEPDGSNFRNLTQSDAFDFWPAWSPDGQYLTFVSDRAMCPTWEPNAANSCYAPDAPTPDGGNLYVYDDVSGKTSKLSDAWVSAPPRWITPTRIAFTTGTHGDPTTGNGLGWVDVKGGPDHIIIPTDTSGMFAIGSQWSPDGHSVVYQETGPQTAIVVRDDSGNVVIRSEDPKFPRADFDATWSPDGQSLAIGGQNNQCPFGMTLTDPALKPKTSASPNPGVCNPIWSPDGRYIAFIGVVRSKPGTDGRLDVYVSTSSSYYPRNLTTKFGGQLLIVGWVGGQ